MRSEARRELRRLPDHLLGTARGVARPSRSVRHILTERRASWYPRYRAHVPHLRDGGDSKTCHDRPRTAWQRTIIVDRNLKGLLVFTMLYGVFAVCMLTIQPPPASLRV